MPDQYAAALRELVQAKIEQRAPEIVMEAKGEAPKVINIMAALKESVQAKGRAKLKEAVRKRSGKPPKEEARAAPAARARAGARRVVH
jgi:non-homologous end joining protein Ku